MRNDRILISPGYVNESKFLHAVDNMRWFLSLLSYYFEAEGIQRVPESGFGPNRHHCLSDVQEAIVAESNNPIFSKLTALWSDFEIAAAQIPSTLLRADGTPSELDPAKVFARNAQRQLYNYLDQSPFAYSARQPPSGQPGDTLVIRMILGESITAETLLGCILDRFHLATPVAEAHRNRIEIISDWLDHTLSRTTSGKLEQVRIVSLGCGPAREVPAFIERNRSNPALRKIEFTLQDFSPSALKIAEEGISQACRVRDPRPDFHFSKTNAFRLAVQYNSEHLPELEDPPFTLVYCAGLYDYLDDEVAAAVTAALFHRLAPGELMLITNVSSNNPNRYAQELLLNWPIIYRDRGGMIEMGDRLGQFSRTVIRRKPNEFRFFGRLRDDLLDAHEFIRNPEVLAPGEFCVTSDLTGVNLFLWIRSDA
jgi:extracellular factor (EF) 3-hydroxypalmitic acid methyl ester biosynthesis protein